MENEKERFQKILKLRRDVLWIYGTEAYYKLPSYEEMLADGKEVTVKNYLDVDKVINLN